MKKNIVTLMACVTMALHASAQLSIQDRAFGKAVDWDQHSLIIDGHRVVPVMGEIHYSRLPETEWKSELQKMKAGGVTVIANYVFWNHVEETEGVFDWSGRRSLRHFLQLCKEEGLPVVLRIGPFCHGEARNGGFPDWMVEHGGKLRSEDPKFLANVETLYRQIFTQVQGLQWKDGGPVIACQFDNEYGGNASYLLTLKRIALNIGYEMPFYTYTGWPGLRTPMPYREMIPLYGDYADGFWDRKTDECTGNYWKAFNFSDEQISGAIGSEQLDYNAVSSGKKSVNKYPYFTCELGGGMMTSYHRRVYMYPEDAYAMALVKLGSGSNLLGYYMYHGGTNPDGKTYLNECQRTPTTNYNDLPVKTYDFQAPLGEFGQKNPHYFTLRRIHLFMRDFGELLAPMEAHFPQAGKEMSKGIDTYLRWSYREKDGSAFVFVNNYERLQNLTAKKGVQFSVCGQTFPAKAITIPAGAMAILPVNIKIGQATINYATAQLMSRHDNDIYMACIDGVAPEVCINGKVYKNVRPQAATAKPFAKVGELRFHMLTTYAADHLYLDPEPATTATTVAFTKQKEAGPLRKITMGVAKAAEEPTDEDFKDAAVYAINIPDAEQTGLLRIKYQGDVARLYVDGQLVADNFYNGREFLYSLTRLPHPCSKIELRILPLQKDMPIYFPREADTTPGECVTSVEIIK